MIRRFIPLLLILVGVIGGLISFGFIGLFIGPMALAVSFTLVVDWVQINNPATAVETTTQES